MAASAMTTTPLAFQKTLLRPISLLMLSLEFSNAWAAVAVTLDSDQASGETLNGLPLNIEHFERSEHPCFTHQLLYVFIKEDEFDATTFLFCGGSGRDDLRQAARGNLTNTL